MQGVQAVIDSNNDEYQWPQSLDREQTQRAVGVVV